jgi:uncharacterized membrane protein
MRRLAAYFFRGLLVLAPLAVTVYVCWAVLAAVDEFIGRWVPIPVPGAGLLLTLALITAVGFLASNLLTRGLLALLERLLVRVPLVRFLYTSTRDLFSAFVGENRRFDRPVLVRIAPEADVRAIGFVTQTTLEQLGLAGHAAVYFPQSYNVAGNLVLIPADRVEPLDADSSAVMAFIVSGGVTALPSRRTPPSSIATQGVGGRR